ncbi:MAG: tetraacyldisaccharide 4'-kinase [Gemmatimonadota bacterium]
MRMLLEEPVRNLWDGGGGIARLPLALLTQPPALIFGALSRTRNFLYDRGVLGIERGPLPVVSVGNLTVGGTGKTPVSRWLIEEARHLGAVPALVARGYGEDEILLHRRWNPDAPVVVATRRILGVSQAAADGATLCILDDGFQHRRLARDLDILLLSVDDPRPARLLPRGPYREPLGNMRRADVVLVTSRTGEGAVEARRLAGELGSRKGTPPIYPFPFREGSWQALDGRIREEGPRGPVLVVTSVARPEGVHRLAREAGAQAEEALSFPDHHPYRERDVAAILSAAGDRAIVTTEKDAVKLLPFAERLARVYVLTLRPDPAPAVARVLREMLRNSTGERVHGGSP